VYFSPKALGKQCFAGRLPSMVEVQCWEVVGGADKGGILVRSGQSTSSTQLDARISFGAVLEELELVDDRLHYKVLDGTGPETGWVSTKLKNKPLVAKTEKSSRTARQEGTKRGNDNAARGPGPHNGPLEKDVAEWILARYKENEPEGIANEKEVPSSEVTPFGWLSRCGLQRVANFRDAAGADPGTSFKCTGGRIRRGLLYRTGQWNSATLEDMRKIRDEFGIKSYLDLRTGETFEGAAGYCYDEEWYPPCPSGRHKGLPERKPGEHRRIHCPFTKNLKLRSWTADEKAMKVPVESGKAEDRRATCSWWYQQMIRTTSFQDLRVSLSATMRAVLFMNYDEVLKAMQVMTDRDNFPVAYGCQAGKDRTGLLGQLVLSALGVSQEDILADYLATNQSSAHIAACIKVMMSRWHEELKEKQPKLHATMVKHGSIDEADAPSTDPKDTGNLWEKENVVSSKENLEASKVHQEIMQYTFHVLDTECGGVINYLESIGFGPSEVERMREILVEPDA